MSAAERNLSGRLDGRTLADPEAATRTLRSAWEAFQTEHATESSVRSLVAESWERARGARVDAGLQHAELDIDPHDMDVETEGRAALLRAAKGVLGLLSHELAGSKHLVAIADSHGRIMLRHGDREVLQRCGSQGFAEGFLWDESSCGTNAVGTALAINRPVQIFSAEHFCSGWQQFVCSAAPVRDPLTRDVIGVIDVTGPATALTGHTYSLARFAAAEVETQLAKQLGGHQRELLECYLRTSGANSRVMLSLDAGGNIVLGNRLAFRHLTTQDLGMLQTMSRQVLHDGGELRERVALQSGPAMVEIALVRRDGRPIGAMVSARPASDPPRRPVIAEDTALGLAGASVSFLEAMYRTQRLWMANSPIILITGASGTGKTELAKRLTATAQDENSGYPVDCFSATWWDDLDKAREGCDVVTVEHVDELSPSDQRRLATRIDVMSESATRLILTSTCPLAELERPLANRLTAGVVALPPLCDRLSDLPLLIEAWSDREEQHSPPRPTITAEASMRLMRHSWPGNVGELFAVLSAAKIVRRGQALHVCDLQLEDTSEPPPSSGTLDELELDATRRTMRQTGGNVSEAARLLGVSRSTLHRRLRSYRLRGVIE